MKHAAPRLIIIAGTTAAIAQLAHPTPQLLAQELTPEPPPSNANDPLIDVSGERLIYLGLFLIFVTLIVIVGLINKQLERALIFGLVLTAIFVFLMFVVL